MMKSQSFFWTIFLQFVCILWYFSKNIILIYFNAQVEKGKWGRWGQREDIKTTHQALQMYNAKHNAQVLAMLHALEYKTLEFNGFGEQQQRKS